MTADPAKAHGRPLESQQDVIVITANIDLNREPFGYGKGPHEHSAQFLGTSMLRYTYWVQLLQSFGFTETID